MNGPRKRITHIPANIEKAQRQIIDLFDRALNRDGGKIPCLNGWPNTIVCSKRRTYKNVGAIALWMKNKSSDEAFKLYRREYKKRFAWIKMGKILPE